jgi:hypothetical protein
MNFVNRWSAQYALQELLVCAISSQKISSMGPHLISIGDVGEFDGGGASADNGDNEDGDEDNISGDGSTP